MNVKIQSIADGGNLDKERIVIKVESPTDIGRYLIFDSGLSDRDYPYSGKHVCFWFPDQPVKPGDLVVLYSKDGTASSVDNQDGSKTYFYYWRRTKAQFGAPRTAAILILVSEWVKRATT